MAFRDRRAAATYHRVPVRGALPLDITDGDAVRRLVDRLRPTAILLAAAEAYAERCERDPAATRRVNVDAARAVIDAAHATGATVVVFSSEYVFDGAAGPYREDEAMKPHQRIRPAEGGARAAGADGRTSPHLPHVRRVRMGTSGEELRLPAGASPA